MRRQAVEYALKLLRALPQHGLSMLRLFFALQPTLEQNTALTAHVAPLVAQLEARAVPAQNLHATLCFIGAVEAAAVSTHCAPRRRACAAGRRDLRFDALEYWETPQILCATAGRDSSAAALSSRSRWVRPRSRRDLLRTSNRSARI